MGRRHDDDRGKTLDAEARRRNCPHISWSEGGRKSSKPRGGGVQHGYTAMSTNSAGLTELLQPDRPNYLK